LNGASVFTVSQNDDGSLLRVIIWEFSKC
jgi:hypothetical protein